jgi:hypothetical protein
VFGLAWNGSRYVAVGDASAISGDPRSIAFSDDGNIWQYAALPPAINAAALTSVVWTGSEFVTVGGFGTALTSPDGVTWTNDFTGSLGFFSTIATAGGKCVAGGLAGLLMADPVCDDVIFRNGFESN